MRNSLPGTPFSERDQAMQPTQWKSWGMSGGLKSALHFTGLHSAFCIAAGGGAATQILLAVYHQRGTSCLPPALLQCLHVH